MNEITVESRLMECAACQTKLYMTGNKDSLRYMIFGTECQRCGQQLVDRGSVCEADIEVNGWSEGHIPHIGKLSDDTPGLRNFNDNWIKKIMNKIKLAMTV
jgi:hypothetical protein